MKLHLLVFLAAALTGGCVSKLPLISHAHLGHTLTTWHDTPDQEGLFVVAVKELDIALAEAAQARASLGDPLALKRHALNVVHALDPGLQPFGPGLSYGAIRALEGAVDHLEFAAASEDASANMVATVVNIARDGDRLRGELESAVRDALAIQSAEPASLPALTEALHARLQNARHGRAGDPTTASALGIDQAIRGMLDRERDPSYAPVPRRYVLGLVRLPSGFWAYRLPRPHAGHHRGYGGYGGY